MALALVTPATATAQQLDVVRGRVVGGADSTGIPDALVTVVSTPGGISRTTRTEADGRFAVTFPASSDDFVVTVLALGFAPRRTELKRFGTDLLFLDVRMEVPVPELDTLQVQGDRRLVARDARGTPDIGGSERQVEQLHVPTDQLGSLDVLAASVPGVQLITRSDGTTEGFSVLGLGGDQNAVTLNGVPFGAAGIPRDAQVRTSVATAPFDPSRGGFSGAELALATQRGSNIHTRTTSLMGDAPQLQWSDRAAGGLGERYSNAALGGRQAGPIRIERTFYDVSWQVSRRSSDFRSILTADHAALGASGIAPDSVERLAGLLGSLGIPTGVDGIGRSRVNERAVLLGDISLTPAANSGHALSIVLHGAAGRSTPTGITASTLPTTGGEQGDWSGGAQLRHTNYFSSGFLSETNVSAAGSRSWSSPFVDAPGGQVRVQSEFDGAEGGVRTIGFGGNTGLRRRETSRTFGAQTGLSFYSRDGRHRLRLLAEGRAAGYRREDAADLLGTFVFNSLEDFAAGRAASFTRQLNSVGSTGQHFTGALSLADVLRVSPTLQIQAGIRLDGHRFASEPVHNAALHQALAVRNDATPRGWLVSPRFGFEWRGASDRRLAPRVSGGIGVFQGLPATSLMDAAQRNTGLPTGIQRLECVGAAVPVPDWPTYVANPGSVPMECADGTTGGVVNVTTPRVSLFASNWQPSRSLRSSLQWAGGMLGDRLALSASAQYSRNTRQPRTVDRNFAGTVGFTLPSERSRPVFVGEQSIAPATGVVAWNDARVTPLFSRVMETRSDLRSEAGQLTLTVAPATLSYRVGWTLSYVYSRFRQEVSGFASTAGDPTSTEWARSPFDARHQISYGLALNLADWVRVNWFSSLRSGLPFTPMVSADVNGDGFTNDRAFVFDPETGPPQVQGGMRDLLARGSPTGRRCLAGQLGRVAGHNSCEGPWTTTALLSATFNPVKLGISPRALLSVQLANPLVAADLLLHGSDGLRGWGQSAVPEETLLHVTGFDAQADRFTYAVNPRFGASRPGLTPFRSPARLTVMLRLDLGRSRELQEVSHTLRRGRSLPGRKEPESMYHMYYSTGGIDNPIAEILRRRESLALDNAQANHLAQLNSRYRISLDSIWRPVAAYHAALPDAFDESQAMHRYLEARHGTVSVLTALAREIRAVLTPDQLGRVPLPVARLLDARYLASIRDGTVSPFSGPLTQSGAGLPNPAVAGVARFRGPGG